MSDEKEPESYLSVTASAGASFRLPKDPPADLRWDFEDRAHYALAYGLVASMGFSRPDWGEPLRLTFQDGALIEFRLPLDPAA